MRIMGIDPGSRATGVGVVESKGSSLRCIAAGVVRPQGCDRFIQRLDSLYKGVASAIEEYSPDVFAIEDLFFAKNAKSALKLGHARAAVMLAALHAGLSVYEYTPLEVKKAVVGYGKAEKVQVQQMVKIILNIPALPPTDAADALAVAICHANTVALHASCTAQALQV